MYVCNSANGEKLKSIPNKRFLIMEWNVNKSKYFKFVYLLYIIISHVKATVSMYVCNLANGEKLKSIPKKRFVIMEWNANKSR